MPPNLKKTPSIMYPDRITWSGHTDCGRVRQNNEDAFVGVAVDGHEVRHLGKIGGLQVEASDLVFAVSDGMGGANVGEFASRIAVEKIAVLLPPLFKQRASGLSAGFEDVLEELFAEIHKALLYLGSCYEECSGMGATLSLCWFTPGWMHFGHIGDSRIYYLPAAGGIRQLSEDDTHVGWLLRTGAINEWEAKNHPRRNILQKALGAGHQFASPQIGAVGYGFGDRFLICSDGVTEGVYDEQLIAILEEEREDISPAHHLVNEAIARSGRDNSTAVIVAIDRPPQA